MIRTEGGSPVLHYRWTRPSLRPALLEEVLYNDTNQPHLWLRSVLCRKSGLSPNGLVWSEIAPFEISHVACSQATWRNVWQDPPFHKGAPHLIFQAHNKLTSAKFRQFTAFLRCSPSLYGKCIFQIDNIKLSWCSASSCVFFTLKDCSIELLQQNMTRFVGSRTGSHYGGRCLGFRPPISASNWRWLMQHPASTLNARLCWFLSVAVVPIAFVYLCCEIKWH